jgi:6-phosphofructokinase 1
LCRSSVDAREAYETGRFAVQAALSGESERMVALRRRQGKSYDVGLELVPLSKASERERVLPARFCPRQGAITSEFYRYVSPLIGDPLPSADCLDEGAC